MEDTPPDIITGQFEVSATFVVSGGISSIDDIKKIKTLKQFNVEGVIIGKAIYDGDIKLSDLKDLENA